MLVLHESDAANARKSGGDALHSRDDASADLGDLQVAAAAARAARDSLRRLITALCATPADGSLGSCAGSDLSLAAAACSADPGCAEGVAAKRARFERSAAEFEAAALTAFDVSPLESGIRWQGVRARRSATADEADSLDLAPRLRLRAPAGSRGVRATSLWCPTSSRLARLAVVLGSGRLELWERDLFSWHCLASVDSLLQSCASASLSFAAEGTLLWVVVAPESESGALASRLSLFSCDGGAGSLRLLASADGPAAAPWAAGPVPIAIGGGEAVALAFEAEPSVKTSAFSASEGPTLRLWSVGSADDRGGEFTSVASCSLGDVDTAVAGLWALPASPEPLVVAWLRLGGGACGELQVRSCSGDVLARLPLTSEVRHLVVPPQGLCPAEATASFGAGASPLPPFVALAERGGQERAEWAVAVVVAERPAAEGLPMSLRVKPLLVVYVPAPCTEVTGICGSLVACRAAGSAPYLLDWQHGCTHPLPSGRWLPVAVGPSTVVLRGRPEPGAEEELLLLEPR